MLAAGCQARQYLGKAGSADEIELLSEDKVEKLYARYEARLCTVLIKTLGQAALQLYSGVVSLFLPIPPENQPALVRDLKANPFVGHLLRSATCELYHHYGMYLAPLTTALTTFKHCQFKHQCPLTINDGGEPDGSAYAGKNACGKNDPKGNIRKTQRHRRPGALVSQPKRRSKNDYLLGFRKPKNHNVQ